MEEPTERRSPCPLACGLDVFGDKWTLLVVRDLLFGDKRFKDFTTAPERIPTNLLSDRLARLTAHGLVEHVPTPPGGSRHLAYRLTAKGRSLRPVLTALRDWALAWVPGTEDQLSPGRTPPAGNPGSRPVRKRLPDAARKARPAPAPTQTPNPSP